MGGLQRWQMWTMLVTLIIQQVRSPVLRLRRACAAQRCSAVSDTQRNPNERSCW
jgi:hypothetical protein